MREPLPVLEQMPPICCRPIGSTPSLSPEDAAALAVRLKALADPVRLRLVSTLMDQPGREGCTCNMAPVVHLSEPTVSHHLKKLVETGLLTKERRGMSVFYRVVPEAIHAIAAALHVTCECPTDRRSAQCQCAANRSG